MIFVFIVGVIIGAVMVLAAAALLPIEEVEDWSR